MNAVSITTKISITGDLGSGKSVVSKILKQLLGFEIYSTGKVQREIAARLGMSTLELNQFAENHPEIDDEIDSAFIRLNAVPEGLIVDARLAWFFMPASFKVFLTVPIQEAARRIMNDPTRNSEKYADTLQAVQELRARKASENERFLEKYNADCAKLSNFDLVIDTAEFTPEQVAEQIVTGYRAWKSRVAEMQP